MKGRIKTKIGNKEFKITKEHFQIVQKASEPYAVKVQNYGTVIINSKLDDELLKDGFARDFIRNIQNIRKQLNLSRFKERIRINVVSDIDIIKELGEYLDTAKEETGSVGIGKDKKGQEFSFKVQGKKIDVYIEVIDS